jgi:hypothetical protein
MSPVVESAGRSGYAARVGASDFDRIGVAALGRETGALVPANPELLGDVVLWVLAAGVHDLPA